MSRTFGVFSLLILFVKCDDLDYCYSTDVTPYKLFSTWTPTDYSKNAENKNSECRPIYLWALLKHGMKNITDQQIKNSEDLEKVKADIEQNEKEKRTALCWEDYQNIHSSALFSLNQSQNEILANKALHGHDLIASYFRRIMNSSPAFQFDKENVKIETSEAKEAHDSALKFARKFMGKSIEKEVVTENNELLRTKSSCPNWVVNNTEADNFTLSPIFKSMLLEVSFRLGFQNELPMETVRTMYESCVFWNLLSDLFRPPFCAAFTPDHLKIMEYWQDLKHYYEFGYGNELSEKMGCPLVNHMINRLNITSNGKYEEKQGQVTITYWDGERVNIFFGDDENLMGLITRMKLYQDEEVPKHDNYYRKKTNRKWRSSLLSPFDGSVHAILYKCKNDERKIEFYHNHEIVKFDACKNSQDGKCSFETFNKEVLRKLRDQCENCCGSSPKNLSNEGKMISYSFIVMIVCFFFNRLNLF